LPVQEDSVVGDDETKFKKIIIKYINNGYKTKKKKPKTSFRIYLVCIIIIISVSSLVVKGSGGGADVVRLFGVAAITAANR